MLQIHTPRPATIREPFNRATLLCLAVVTVALASCSPAQRVDTRNYPSVFQPWSPATHEDGTPLTEHYEVTQARHDLFFGWPTQFELVWNQEPKGLATGFTTESIEAARAKSARLRALNPNIVLLAEVHYRDAADSFLPSPSHRWWWRKKGKRVPGWEEGNHYILNFRSREFRRHVAARAKALMDTGVFDGVMLDWWHNDTLAARKDLVRRIRNKIGEDALILVNANQTTSPNTAEFINGAFMEVTESQTRAHWDIIENTLRWNEANFRTPTINCLETWFHNSRRDLHLMRATTTLALTHSRGYTVFSDPNPLEGDDHLHDWYSFWDKGLGRPVAGKNQRRGAFVREYTYGFAIYNPKGNGDVTLSFEEPLESRATGWVGTTHTIPNWDGDILIRPHTCDRAPNATSCVSPRGCESICWAGACLADSLGCPDPS